VEWEEDAASKALKDAASEALEDAAPEALAESAEYWDSECQKRIKKIRGCIFIIKAEQLWSDFKSLKFEDKHPYISDE
jgi:hypothetical protein